MDPLWPLAVAVAVVLIVVAVLCLARAAALGDRGKPPPTKASNGHDPLDEIAWWRYGVVWADEEEE